VNDFCLDKQKNDICVRAIMVGRLLPTDLLGWVPANPLGYGVENNPWVEDIRFQQLAELHSHEMMKIIAPKIGWSSPRPVNLKILLHKKKQDGIAGRACPLYFRANTPKPNGNAVFKRYVQLAPWNYHANFCQLYIESFFEGANAEYKAVVGEKLPPPIDPIVGPKEMVIFVGVIAGLKGMLDWNSKVSMDDEYFVRAEHDRVNELIHHLDENIDSSIFSNHPPFISTDSEDEIRYRIQLPRQSLEAESWNDHLRLVLNEMMIPVMGAFNEIALGQVDF